jgi:cytochrome P450
MEKSEPSNKIPFEKGIPLLGVSLSLAKGPEDFLMQMYKKHGPIFEFNAAHFNYVCMAGQDANDFMNSEGKDCFETRPFWEPLSKYIDAPNAITVLDGPPHKTVRAAYRAPLSRKTVDDNVPDVTEIIKKVFDEFAGKGEVPFVPISQKLSSNIVGHLLMGQIPSDEELKYFFKYANTLTVMLSVMRLPAAALLLSGPGFYKAKRLSKALINNTVENALTNKSSRKLLIQYLIEAQKEYPDLFTDGDIKSSGFLAFFGGIDTMGQTLAFMIWELLKSPDTLKEVQKEVDAVFDQANGELSPENIHNNLPLCKATFMETLRLHPTAFGIVRSAASDFEFKGYMVKKGQDMLLYTTLTHHLPEFFKDPDKFDIYRFAEGRSEHRQRGAYTPFGRGNHTCAGAAWSESQAILMLATLLRYYSLSMPESMRELKKIMKTTPTLGDKFKVSVDARNH